MADNPSSPGASTSHFPSHSGPRVWLISAGDSPIGLSISRQLLAHGDYVVLGLVPPGVDRDDSRSADFDTFMDEVDRNAENGWKERLRATVLDIRCGFPAADFYSMLFMNLYMANCIQLHARMMGKCQSVAAGAVHAFGKIDVLLCCTSQGKPSRSNRELSVYLHCYV